MDKFQRSVAIASIENNSVLPMVIVESLAAELMASMNIAASASKEELLLFNYITNMSCNLPANTRSILKWVSAKMDRDG